MRLVKQRGIYQHFKGNYYMVEAVAKDSETQKNVVIYRPLYGDGGLWVRDEEMFLSEVDHQKYPEVKQRYRFELLNENQNPTLPFKLIVCDIDSTLTDNAHNVSDVTKKAIAEVRKKGYLFGLASGRPVEDIDEYYKDWGLEEQFDVLIGFNGAQVYNKRTNQTQSYHLMKREWMKETIDLLRPFHLNPNIYYENDFMALYDDEYLHISSDRVGRKFIICDREEQLYQQDNAKILFRVPAADMPKVEAFVKEHPSENYVGFRTQPTVYEFCHKDVNKGYGLQQYCLQEGIDLSEVIAFGDTTNDNLMLQCCYGVCMLNGTEDTKACAKEITELDNVANGWAHYVYKKLM